MNISDEAVKAAWLASLRNDVNSEDIIRILEAAAPHILAPVVALADEWQEDFPYKARQLRAATTNPYSAQEEHVRGPAPKELF